MCISPLTVLFFMLIGLIQAWFFAPWSLWAWTQSALVVIEGLNFTSNVNPQKPPTAEFTKSQMKFFLVMGLVNVVLGVSHYLWPIVWRDVPSVSILLTVGIGVLISIVAGLGLWLSTKIPPHL